MSFMPVGYLPVYSSMIPFVKICSGVFTFEHQLVSGYVKQLLLDTIVMSPVIWYLEVPFNSTNALDSCEKPLFTSVADSLALSYSGGPWCVSQYATCERLQ